MKVSFCIRQAALWGWSAAPAPKECQLHNQLAPETKFVWYMWPDVSGSKAIASVLFFGVRVHAGRCSKTLGCGLDRPVVEWPVRLRSGLVAPKQEGY